MCNAVANNPLFQLSQAYSTVQTIVTAACYALAVAAPPLAPEIIASCNLSLTAWAATKAAYGVGNLLSGNSLQNCCSNTIPDIANSINSRDPLNIQTKIQVTGVSPVYIPSATTSTTYSGIGPFPGVGGISPLSYDFNTLGLCALAGARQGAGRTLARALSI
jgi:hypothetical protein